MRRCTRASGTYRRHICTKYQHVRSISMYQVSVLLLLYYSKQYLPQAVSSPKYVGWIRMTTIRDTRTFFLRRKMRKLHVYVHVCMYPQQQQQQQQQPTASSTCDMEISSSYTVNVVAELLWFVPLHAVENCRVSKLHNAEFCR